MVVLIGGALYFLLRPKGQYYELIGDAYVHEVMNGEMLEIDEQGNVRNTQEFGLI